jgi:uncharacterized protein (DUF302 family)
MENMMRGYSMKKVIGCWLAVFLLVLPLWSVAEVKSSGFVYKHQINKSVSEVYDSIYKSLEDARFFVVFEPNIGANLKRFAEKWGKDYNQNKLSEIRSMVFCNGWYANPVSNLDPDMLGFCPLHISLIEHEGKTTVLFNRPSVMAAASPAQTLLKKIELDVIAAIEQGAH